MIFLIIFFTFWVITSKYINSILYLFPTILQQISPTDSITAQIFISSTIAFLCFFLNLAINSLLENNEYHFNYWNINNLLLIISINPIFWMNINLIEHFSNTSHTPQLIAQFSIINFINFNLLLIILLIILFSNNSNIHHSNTIIITLTIIFLPNLSSIIVILPIIILLEINLLILNINNENIK